MKKKERIVRYSIEQLRKMKSKTDWAKVDAMTQAEVERLADEEEGPLPKGWQKSIIIGLPPGVTKQDIHIRLDRYVIDWFKARGRGYQTKINTVLREFVDRQTRGGHGNRIR
jgi:uncharacterized protein (DUF4415 family)